MITAKTYRSGLITGRSDSTPLDWITPNDALLPQTESGRLIVRHPKLLFMQPAYTPIGGKGGDLTTR